MEDVKKRPSANDQAGGGPCLCAALRQATRAVTRIYDAELRGTGLRVTQHFVLKLLSRSGEVRHSDLADLASLDPTTLTGALGNLERSGWVRSRVGADRRERLVKITNAGRRQIERARPAWSRAEERIQRMVPQETWELLFAALPKVAQAASQGTADKG